MSFVSQPGAQGKEWPPKTPGKRWRAFFWLGAGHLGYKVLGRDLPNEFKPYAWFLRVVDLPGFVRHVAPALERRLAESLLVSQRVPKAGMQLSLT